VVSPLIFLSFTARQWFAKQTMRRDKFGRKDGTFERADFTYDPEDNAYTCPRGKKLRQFRRVYKVPRSSII
jgi:hypothetical protein